MTRTATQADELAYRESDGTSVSLRSDRDTGDIRHLPSPAGGCGVTSRGKDPGARDANRT
jgi:hypothetical protein